jgi:putative Holliday junction resolvase
MTQKNNPTDSPKASNCTAAADSMETAESADTSGCIEPTGRLGGIDYGTVRIGVAISDPGQSIASPLEVYQVRSPNLNGKYFRRLAETEKLVGWVVGLPVHMSGDHSDKSREAMAFGNWLSKQTGLPVVWVDERYSTARAREILNQSNLSGKKRKAQLDKIAAQVLLSTYLDGDRDQIVLPPKSIED